MAQLLESNLVKFAALGAVASGVALYAYNKYCPIAKKPADSSCGSCCCSKSAKKKRAVEYVSETSPVVVIDYSDLVSDEVDLSEPIETAFGYDGLGLITVRGVPNFPKLRGELLPLAHKFAMLPESIKAKYEHPSSHYSFGWSHGKEQFEGKPDLAKGSYYNNPLYDRPFDDPEVIKKYASFAHPNIWPTEDLPQLEPAFKNLGSLIIEVGTLLAKHCDRFVKARAPKYPADKLERVIKTGKCVKARLLHYFAVDKPAGSEQKEVDYGSWCGWHNDHGSLTGLALGMYIDKSGKEIPCPDPNAGLYIQSRNGKVVRAAAPTDYMAFQMGETHQVHSGGVLLATPHCVRAATNEASQGVSRESFAVFMEPLWDEPMNVPDGLSPDDAKRGTQRNYLPRGVPPLERRWVPTDDFGQFTKKTIDEYTIFN